MTLKAALDAIQQAANAVAPNRLTAVLNDAGTAIVLKDATVSGGNVRVDPLNGSNAAADLGIQRSGIGATLEGTPLSDSGSDIRITLTNGKIVGVDLSEALTVSDVIDLIGAANPLLHAQFVGSAIVISDTAGGSGQLQVIQLNGSTADTELGILGTAPGGNRSTLMGTPIGIASVVLNGMAGNDTLIGTSGNDLLTGGLGADTIDGGAGFDTVVESRDANFTLTNTTLIIGADAADTLAGIETADLSGGAGVNTLDASAFTLGSVTLRTGGGLDILKGTGSDDQFVVDVAGLTAPSNAVDPTHQVRVNGGGGSGDNIVYRNAPRSLSQNDLNYTLTEGNGVVNYTFKGTEFVITTDVVYPGMNLIFDAPKISVLGGRIDVSDTRSGTYAGSITLKGAHIVVDDGARLIADGNRVTPLHGQISLLAIDDRAAVQGLGFGNVDIIVTDVNIGDATIRGGDVVIQATADSQRLLLPSDFGTNSIGQLLGSQVLGGISLALEQLSIFVGVAVAKSKAHVNIGTNPNAPTNIIADNFTALSTAKTLTLVQPIGVIFGGAVGIAITESFTTIDNANISTRYDATIRSTTDHIVDVLADAAGPAAIGIGVSIIKSETSAHVTDDAVLTVGRDLYVQADTTDRTRTMGRGTTGAEGIFSLSVGLGIVVSDTTAALDGQADVTGNVNVTANQVKLPVPANKTFVIPSFASGVNAASGTGVQSTGDFLDDSKAALTSLAVDPILDVVKGGLLGNNKVGNKVAKWNGFLFTKVKAWADAPDVAERKPVQIGAAVAAAVEGIDVTARIGDSNLTSQTTVNAGGFISVSSKDVYRPDVSATARAIGDGDRFSSDGLTELEGDITAGVALSVAIGIYDHDTNSYIGGNAVVNARGSIDVTANTLNAIDPNKLFGANLFAETDSKSKYTTDDQTKVLSFGDVIQLSAKYTAGGLAGTTYRYIGPDGAQINLGIEDYSNKLKWEAFNPAVNAGFSYFRTLTLYLGDNLALDDILADSFSQSAASGQKKASVAGSVTVMNLDQRAWAMIQDGASVNQNPAFTGTGQTVAVVAHSQNDAVNIGGNFQLPSVSSGLASSTNAQSWGVDRDNPVKFTPLGAGGGETEGAVGVTVLVVRYQNDVQAIIGNGVNLKASSLQVEADNEVLGVMLALRADDRKTSV